MPNIKSQKDRVRQAAINLRQQNINLPPMQELRRQVLERMITEKATEQRAKELGIRVDEQMVSASIEQIARNNKMTVDELRERLRADDVSFGAFRAQVRDEITALGYVLKDTKQGQQVTKAI